MAQTRQNPAASASDGYIPLRDAADWGLVGIAALAAIALFLPVAVRDGVAVGWLDNGVALLFVAGVVFATILGQTAPDPLRSAFAELAGVTMAWILPFAILAEGGTLAGAWGLWLFLLAATIRLWRILGVLAARPGWMRRLLVPGLFGAGLLLLWEVLVRGLDIPLVLLPAPSRIVAAAIAQSPVLWMDFKQTVLTSVVRGYVMGCAAGFAVALIADRIPFLARGLLPIGNLASAIPVVGIAPIMVMWFGFDWPSKAAVIVVMTFFPMLVNTLAGLASAERMQLDLMRSYGASHWTTLFKLRLPSAMPFLFNGLKINSTLALIGAIVAEFFGTPIVGMGFRISTEVARMNLDIVWATILVAALTGSLLYGALALLERHFAGWHPSLRG